MCRANKSSLNVDAFNVKCSAFRRYSSKTLTLTLTLTFILTLTLTLTLTLIQVRAEEREKVAAGKTPFYMKQSQLRQMALEDRFCIRLTLTLTRTLTLTPTLTPLSTPTLTLTQTPIRYDELKASGKLRKFVEKKRRRNAAKDRKWMPDEA